MDEAEAVGKKRKSQTFADDEKHCQSIHAELISIFGKLKYIASMSSKFPNSIRFVPTLIAIGTSRVDGANMHIRRELTYA